MPNPAIRAEVIACAEQRGITHLAALTRLLIDTEEALRRHDGWREHMEWCAARLRKIDLLALQAELTAPSLRPFVGMCY